MRGSGAAPTDELDLLTSGSRSASSGDALSVMRAIFQSLATYAMRRLIGSLTNLIFRGRWLAAVLADRSASRRKHPFVAKKRTFERETVTRIEPLDR